MRTLEPAPGSHRDLAWVALPLAAYAAVLVWLGFDAPGRDDYEAVLGSAIRLADASSLREWFSALVAQHDGNRIPVTRGLAWSLAALSGHVDFRVLVLLGNLALVGLFVLLWLEFRSSVAPLLATAAAFVLFQWSYYEAALTASGAWSHLAAVFFSLACLFLAPRGGAAAAAGCVGFGLLAAGSQANGLFALPLAAMASLRAGRRARAAVFLGMAVAMWVAYFIDYARPAGQPGLVAALGDPITTFQRFLGVLGAVFPGRWAPIGVGVAILALIAWLARRGLWRRTPTAGLWIVFVLLSAAMIAAGEVASGVHHASRHAVYSSCLLAIALLGLAVATAPWNRPTVVLTVIGAAIASFSMSLASWPAARDHATRARLLVKVADASGAREAAYHGMSAANPEAATRILREAERRGLYAPPAISLHPASVRAQASLPSGARLAGHLDEITVAGPRLAVRAWTDVPPTAQGREVIVYAPRAQPTRVSIESVERPDVANALNDQSLLFAGLQLDIDYADEAAAREAAASLCLAVSAPGRHPAILGRRDVSCPPSP